MGYIYRVVGAWGVSSNVVCKTQMQGHIRLGRVPHGDRNMGKHNVYSMDGKLSSIDGDWVGY